MPMALSAACEVVADAAGLTLDHVKGVARRLQEQRHLPRSRGGRLPAVVDERHVAVLLLALLVPVPSIEAARLAAEFGRFENEGLMAEDYVAKLLVAAASDGQTSTAVTFTSVTVHTAHSLPRCAVVVRHSCTDEPIEEAFTPDGGPWAPDEGGTITEARTMPGLLLRRIGCDLAAVAL